MRLHHYTVLYLSGSMFLVLSIWAAVFYWNMLDEIRDSIDDGLENTKLLVIQKTMQDTSLLYKDNFWESNYRIREVRPDESVSFTDMYSDTTLYTENEKDFEPFRMLTTIFQMPNGKYYKLRIISSTVEEDDLIEDLLYALLALYGILVVSMILINNFLLRRIWRPFHQTLQQIRGYKISDREQIEFEATRVDEFRLLQKTLDELLRSNREVFESQKQFIENAAHELQTPLAISINKLEMMVANGQLPEGQMQKLSEVIEALERLGRLNKSLLLLSKIENRQFPETEEIDLCTVARQLMAELGDWADFKSVEVELAENAPTRVRMNRALAEILLTNLLKNAIFHNREGGKVRIVCHARSFVIENSGDKALDADKIFGRFYKGSVQGQSTGLGLAIVRSIADLYGHQIRYEFDGMHRFTIHT